MKKKNLFIALIVPFIMFASCGTEIDYHEIRRNSFSEKLDGGVAVIFSSDQRGRLNKNFYYLTEMDESSLVMVITGCEEPQFKLFAYQEQEGVMPVARLGDYLLPLLEESPHLWLFNSDREPLAELLGIDLSEIGAEISSPEYIFYHMREIKDELELEIITRATDITVQAYLKVLDSLRPGVTEQEIIDYFRALHLDLGAEGTAHIQAGSGVNGTEIHARASQKVIEDGELVVFDTGCWYRRYTTDISRTIPAGGKFTEAQRDIYNLVLKAQKAGIELMVPGSIMRDVQNVVENIILEGLLELGLITDIESPWQRRLYIVHGYYHYIGLDIHDVYSLMARETATKSYEPGMVMTLEPGLYFPPTLLDNKPSRGSVVPDDEEWDAFREATMENFLRYVNNGVRIEDVILITENGNRVLSDGVPREIEDIEAYMAAR